MKTQPLSASMVSDAAGRNQRRSTNAHDLSGAEVGYLKVIEKTSVRYGSSVMWRCSCVCGRDDFLATSFHLKHGKIKSCGCMTREIISMSRTRHAMTDTPTWKSWKSMLDRCLLKAHKSFPAYGGRGITVCKEWFEFEQFYADMGDRPAGTTLGRIDNERGYEKGNCRWETFGQQANNRRSSRVITFDGKTMTLTEWANAIGIIQTSLSKRLASGWSVERALTTPAKSQKNSVSTFLKPRDLRDEGVEIESEFVEVDNRFGERCRVKCYRLAKSAA